MAWDRHESFCKFRCALAALLRDPLTKVRGAGMWVAVGGGDSRMFRWFTALSWPLQLGVTVLALFAIVVARWVGVQVARGLSGGQKNSRALFWTTQLSGLIAFGGAIVMVVAPWTHGGRRDALPLGLVSAGVAVALQKVWTAFGAPELRVDVRR